MKDLNKCFEIARKITRELKSGSGDWDIYIEEEAVRKILRERLNGYELEKRWEDFEEIDVRRALKRIYWKKKRRREKRIGRFGWGAAVVLIGLFVGMWILQPEPLVEPLIATKCENSRGAYLVVEDTGRIDLATMIAFEDRGVTVTNKKEEELSYQECVRQVETPVIHKLVVPKGCEYKLSLADGTRIWMNAESELSYPVAFDSGKREVSLKGQAYFEVAKSDVPFIVKTEQVDVCVLGTSFDVMSYADEPDMQVTLEEGKVQILTERQEYVLIPGQQAVFTRNNSVLSIHEVNTGLYTGWRKGEFIFNNESFASVGRKLSRWYGVDILIDESLQWETLYGSIRRYESLQEFLNILQLTNEVEVIYHDDKVEIFSKEKKNYKNSGNGQVPRML